MLTCVIKIGCECDNNSTELHPRFITPSDFKFSYSLTFNLPFSFYLHLSLCVTQTITHELNSCSMCLLRVKHMVQKKC